MARPVDIGKVMKLAGEAKILNLDVSIGQVAGSQLVDLVNADEPWDLICADWVTLIRRGPRRDLILELATADVLRESLAGIAGHKGK